MDRFIWDVCAQWTNGHFGDCFFDKQSIADPPEKWHRQHQHSFLKSNTVGNLKIGNADPLENFNKNSLSKPSNNAIKKQAVKPTDPKIIKTETINKGKSKN